MKTSSNLIRICNTLVNLDNCEKITITGVRVFEVKIKFFDKPNELTLRLQKSTSQLSFKLDYILKKLKNFDQFVYLETKLNHELNQKISYTFIHEKAINYIDKEYYRIFLINDNVCSYDLTSTTNLKEKFYEF